MTPVSTDGSDPNPLAGATVLFLHPGAMGSRLAGACRGADRRLWLPGGRSAATSERADSEGLEPVDALDDAVASADVVVSICPPAAAESVAELVATARFGGVYVDANAVAPSTVHRIGQRFEHFVDGGIIGPPPIEAGSTRLYLSGAGSGARHVASLWAGSELDARVIDGEAGAASALKMAYAAWTKGSAALLSTIVAGAAAMGVGDDLRREWDLSQPGLNGRVDRMVAGVGPKAWRFAGEMEEIASSFAAVGMPAGFWSAAGEVYERLAPLRETGTPTIDALITLLGFETS